MNTEYTFPLLDKLNWVTFFLYSNSYFHLMVHTKTQEHTKCSSELCLPSRSSNKTFPRNVTFGSKIFCCSLFFS